MNDRDTTRELRRRLQVRFGKRSEAVGMPEHAVLFEVPVDGVQRMEFPDGRHYDRKLRRRIDAVAVGMWTRTEHLVHGFEIKASRSDLVKELRDPQKSEPARRLCDRWWLVLADQKLLGDDPVPDGWGVLYASGRGLRVLTQAAPIESQRDPRFVAALVQSALAGHGTTARGLGRIDGHAAGYKRGEKDGRISGRNEAYVKAYEDAIRATRAGAA